MDVKLVNPVKIEMSVPKINPQWNFSYHLYILTNNIQ